MKITYCFLEIFDADTNQWEGIYDANVPPCLLHTKPKYEVTHFFERIPMYYLLNKIESNDQPTLFPLYKGLPKDSSLPIINEYFCYFVELNFCQAASYIDLNQLFDFKYEKTFDLKEIPIASLQNCYRELVKKIMRQITFKEWLGQKYFSELEDLKRQYGNEKCRLIYFVEDIEWLCKKTEN